MQTTGGTAQKRNLVTNLRTELDFLMAILGDDPILKAFSTQIGTYNDLPDERLDEEVWQACVDIQMTLHDHADTIVRISEIGYDHTFTGTTMFSKLWHFTAPHSSSSEGYFADVTKDLIVKEISAELGTVLQSSSYSLNFTVVKR